jgi:hypothetical protein
MEVVRKHLSYLSDDSDKENDDSMRNLQVAEVKRDGENFTEVMKEADLNVTNRLDAIETIQILNKLHMSTNGGRIIRSMLNQKHANPLAGGL